jgi:hypothetical protein
MWSPTARGRRIVGLRQALAAAALAFEVGTAWAGNGVGGWSALEAWPLIPIHAALTPDGRVLTYGTTAAGAQTGSFIYDVWDPAEGLAAGHLTLPNGTSTDIFCNVQIIVPGTNEIFMAGGDVWTGSSTRNIGNDNSDVFNSTTNELSRGPALSRARWYASMVAMLDGTIYLQGGKGTTTALSTHSDLPERRNADGSMSLLTGADTYGLYYYYPRNFLAPDGRVFGYSDTKMYFVDTTGPGMVSGAGYLPSTLLGGNTQSEAMFRPFKVLRNNATAPGTNAASVIDFAGPVPRITATAPMPVGLQWHNATTLPDGNVVVTGGSSIRNQLVGTNYVAYLWNSTTGRWSSGAPTTSGKARLYHSIALLLPDASVLVGGGGASTKTGGGPQTNTNAEIYYPPYLYESTGRLVASRPTITDAPASLAAGQSFQMQVSSANPVTRLTLIKTGSVTHAFNLEQRFVELSFTTSETTLTAQVPSTRAALPPGRWMLFAFDADGVPSVARLVSVAPRSSARVGTDWTPAFGTGNDGTAFTAACPTGRVLAGVSGSADAKLRAMTPLCVSVNGSGSWIGKPVPGNLVGPGGGTAFSRTCPAGSAVSGLRGRSSDDVDAIDLECRKLGAGAVDTGNPSYLGAVGGTGGLARNAYRCGTNNPAYALYGRTGTTLRGFGLRCRRPTV